ncbi:MAG: pentapeptide repeat-containing protein [Pararhodobacter sp.]|nr:pentapeptide repeat-containing protein [Pararhodobacter sp.]
MTQGTQDDLLVELSARRFSVGFSVFFFAFGIAAGFLMAFAGLGFLEDSAGVIAGVFLVALVGVALAGLIIFMLRRQILNRIFGIAEAQVELFAGPLSGVAEGAASRDPERAIQSARRFIQLALARYAWLATRRWIMTSLTALIAAMAALAGTALLFNQNDLIGRQSTLLAEQNARIREQTMMIAQDVQLAEAARNAQLVVEVTQIAALLGAVADRTAPETGVQGSAALVPMIDPFRDLGQGLIMRIAAVSQSMQPYRFLDTGLNVNDPSDRMRVAMLGRRDDLPGVWAQLTAMNGWRETDGANRLIDRPASPERGLLLRVLVASGLRELQLLSFFGLDLSFAHAQGLLLPMITLDHANMAYADLSQAELREASLAGAVLDNARFRRATLTDTRFFAIGDDPLRNPHQTPGDVYAASLLGADFSDAVVTRADFRSVNAMAAVFDGALLVEADFSEAWLGAASFRGAILVGAQFEGAALQSLDLDGAILFGDDPLSMLEAQAAPGSFRADRYRQDRVDLADVMQTGRMYDLPDPEPVIALIGETPAWRLIRTEAF